MSRDVRLIVTHPGGAHKDDFLACALLAHVHQAPIERRNPTEEEIADPTVCVVDIGGCHDAEANNFDHHQFPADHPPTCSLSLVLQALGLYEDARRYCDWLHPAEWLDSRGPIETARKLKIDPRVLNQLNSPVDMTGLMRFAKGDRHQRGDVIWEFMAMVGGDLVNYLESMHERLAYVSTHAEIWDIATGSGQSDFKAAFMPRTEDAPMGASDALAGYVDDSHGDEEVLGLIYPDRRGKGYGLGRHRDDLRLDFTRIESEEDVHFVHARGFVAKTSATKPRRLRQLMARARVTDP